MRGAIPLTAPPAGPDATTVATAAAAGSSATKAAAAGVRPLPSAATPPPPIPPTAAAAPTLPPQPPAAVPPTPDTDAAAAAVEATHVAAVYTAIAAHFSATRYAPWPAVAAFLAAFPAGSLRRRHWLREWQVRAAGTARRGRRP